MITYISFASAPGNLFNVFGKIGLVVKELRTYQINQETNLTDTTNGLTAQLVTMPSIQGVIGTGYISALNSADTIGTLMQQVANQSINLFVFNSNPQPGQTLLSQNTLQSLQELIRQMNVKKQTVQSATVTASPQPFVGTGNGTMVVSVVRPEDGQTLQNVFAETITATCTNDSYTGGATVNNENFNFTGQGIEPDFFAFDWPLGSGLNGSLQVINGDANNTSGNVLTNSGWETWTSGVPNNWQLVTGTAGTNISQNNGIVYTGTSSLQITGDSAGTLTEIQQQFNDTTGNIGTFSTLTPLTQYSFNVYVRRDGVTPDAGVLRIDLADNTGNTIKDAGGTLNSLSIDLTQLTTNYTAYNIAFRAPQILTSTYFLRFTLTTALTNGRSIYLDTSSLGQMTQLGNSNPYVAIHSGSIPFAQNDYGYIFTTNTRGGGGSLNTFQSLFTRLFQQYMLSNELQLPYSDTPTISDGLIS